MKFTIFFMSFLFISLESAFALETKVWIECNRQIKKVLTSGSFDLEGAGYHLDGGRPFSDANEDVVILKKGLEIHLESKTSNHEILLGTLKQDVNFCALHPGINKGYIVLNTKLNYRFSERPSIDPTYGQLGCSRVRNDQGRVYYYRSGRRTLKLKDEAGNVLSLKASVAPNYYYESIEMLYF